VSEQDCKLNTVADRSPALKNADNLLKDVLKAVDTSGDGQIQYNGEEQYRYYLLKSS
jgi:DNA polymerase III psi subunit